MIGIVCDSGTDLPEELKNKENVRVVPLRVVLMTRVIVMVLKSAKESC